MKNKFRWMKYTSLALVFVFGIGMFGSSSTAQAAGERPKHPRIDLVKIVSDAVMDAVTKATGYSAGQIHQKLRDGESLADIVRDSGHSADAVAATAKASVRAQIDQLVADGKITKQEAVRLDARVDGLVNRLMTRHTRRRHHVGNGTATATPTPSAS